MSHSKFKILIVDDESELLTVMAAHLKFFGYQPYLATSGTKALSLMAGEEMDLVICDFLMPEMDGEELFKKVNQYIPHKPPFIFCSGLVESPFGGKCPEGVLCFLQKPFGMNELLKEVTDYFQLVHSNV